MSLRLDEESSYCTSLRSDASSISNLSVSTPSSLGDDPDWTLSVFLVDSSDNSLISEDEWSDGEGLVAYGQVACNIERGEDENFLDFISRTKGGFHLARALSPTRKSHPKKNMIQWLKN